MKHHELIKSICDLAGIKHRTCDTNTRLTKKEAQQVYAWMRTMRKIRGDTNAAR